MGPGRPAAVAGAHLAACVQLHGSSNPRTLQAQVVLLPCCLQISAVKYFEQEWEEKGSEHRLDSLQDSVVVFSLGCLQTCSQGRSHGASFLHVLEYSVF